MWSKKNLQTTKQDEGSYRIIAVASYGALLIVFLFRFFEIGVFRGSLQYIGLFLLVAGILLRQWSIWVLGKNYTVQVQVDEKAKLVKEDPYKYIRHPSYGGYILSFVGAPLALGTWLGVLVALIANWIAIQNRIRIEEQALIEAFGSEYEEYRRITWEIFPGF
jgi:protein-S-isoprenylcysteine O-methyltransferase Ste14